jgi:phosphotransferase system enzyme I (PtsI)
MVISEEEILVNDISIPEDKLEHEVLRFRRSVVKTKHEIEKVQKRVEKELGESQARIFDTHLLLLDDPILIDKTVELIKEKKKNAEFALKTVSEGIIAEFNTIKIPYIRERVSDIYDISNRIIHYLSAKKAGSLKNISERVILVADNFTPSDVAEMHGNNILGFITSTGSRNSHTAIIARALEIPAVMGTAKATGVSREKIHTGDYLIIDGTIGEIIITPDQKTINRYQRRLQKYLDFEKELLRQRDLPAETTDGKQIVLAANAELPVEIESVLEHGTYPIGLFRTEFLYLNRSTLPSEDEQIEAYRYACERISPHYVVLRTVDLGADKTTPGIHFPKEMNPFLGWRAIRVCMDRLPLFETQLRAVLRASVFGKLKIMFPMITSIEELHAVLKIFNQVKLKLRRDGIKYDSGIEVGVMIETPGAVMIADQLAAEVDFFSIGSNDLIQFTLAVDRSNERIAHLYNPHHPSILRLIKHTIDAGHRNDIWVGICGEMASNPLTTLLLLGMGIDEISLSPISILSIKRVLRSISFEEVRACAQQVLSIKTSAEINAYLASHFGPRIKEMQLSDLME